MKYLTHLMILVLNWILICICTSKNKMIHDQYTEPGISVWIFKGSK